MSSLNLDETREWLDIVYGDTPGLIHICSTSNWRGAVFRMSPDRTEKALAYIARLDSEGVEGIYLRAATLRQAPAEGRGGDELSFYLPGLWGDIDIAGPGHKTKATLPPTVEHAMKIVEFAGLPDPSHWIHSGGGLYPWWLLRNPAEITDVEDFRALSQGWQNALSRGALKMGYAYGSGVGDLSRVLRIPGTVNRKAGLERPCTGLAAHAWSGPMYTLEELQTALLEATPAPPPPSRVEVRLSRGAGAQDEKPGDEFNRTADWHDILLPHGWQWIRRQGDTWYLRRPGKLSGGHSATLRLSTDRLWVFSEEAAPLEPFRLYDKFGAFAALEHHGDFRAATRFLAERGYGTQRPMALAQSFQADPGQPVDGLPVPVPDTSGGDQAQAPADPAVPLRLRDKEGIPIIEPEFFDSFDWNDIAIVSAFAKAHADTLKSIPMNKSWMFWDGTRWRPDDHGRHDLASGRFIGRMLEHAKRVNAVDESRGKHLLKVAHRLAALTRPGVVARAASSDPELARVPSEFNQDKYLITCDNGILDLRTMTLSPHDPSKLMSRKINAPYMPGDSGRFGTFMEQVLPDPQIRGYLQRAVGYALTGEADQRAIFLLHGESGSGKSQVLEALSKVFGDFSCAIPVSAFKPRQEGYKGPSDDLHRLKGVRLAFQSELDQGAVLNEGLIKSVTGADTQSTRELYGKYEDWRPEYTVFLATNYLPRITSSDGAIWKRIKPIKFEQIFVDEDGMPLDPGSADLGAKLAAQQPEAVLNWVLEGLKMYREQGLKPPENVRAWLTDYRDETDTVRQWIKEGEEEGTVATGDSFDGGARELYNAYNSWCLNNHIRPLGSTNFRQRMESSGWKRARTNKGQRWLGIKLTGFIGEAQSPVGSRMGWHPRE